MPEKRSAGTLLHVTSLASNFGIGDFGPAAFEFVDFLKSAGQTIWQILPLCPISHGNSPYSSYSAFAGNTLLISPEELVADGLLSNTSLASVEAEMPYQPGWSADRVDYDVIASFKEQLLAAAFAESGKSTLQSESFIKFCKAESWWLNEFATYEATRTHLDEPDWSRWPAEFRRPWTTNEQSPADLREKVQYSKFKQFMFDGQWKRLKTYCNSNGVQICGDMPIFVAYESADVWANQNQFQLDRDGKPMSVAGVPPDYFSETGQLWGNPLYDWEAMAADNFRWWVQRFQRSLDQFDLLRVDHFRGFDRYWKIPANAKTAAEGAWEAGPRAAPFLAAEHELGKLPIWAEDLGDIDQGVHDLRDQLEFPTMRVFQFGYDSPGDDFHRHTTYSPDCIAYTGTHDNDTLMGWYLGRGTLDEEEGFVDVLKHFVPDNEDVHLQIIQLLYLSPAKVAIVPLQDFLALGNEARMNIPGEPEGNWQWRVEPGVLTAELANSIRELVIASNRF